jgi:hypothetical protein
MVMVMVMVMVRVIVIVIVIEIVIVMVSVIVIVIVIVLVMVTVSITLTVFALPLEDAVHVDRLVPLSLRLLHIQLGLLGHVEGNVLCMHHTIRINQLNSLISFPITESL